MLSRPEIGTKAHILLWLAGEDLDKEYDWDDFDNCPCGQYAQKFKYGFLDEWDRYDWTGKGPLDSGLYDRCLNGIAYNDRQIETWTFGQLYERARKIWGDECK